MQTKQYLEHYKQHLKQAKARKHIQEVKYKTYTENNNKIISRIAELEKMFKKQNLEIYQYNSPYFISDIAKSQSHDKKLLANKNFSPSKKSYVYSQKSELLQQITKLQAKIKKRQTTQIDQITQNLLRKIQDQQQLYSKNLIKKLEIKNRMDLLGVLKQKIQIYEEKVFKLQYGKQAEQQLKKVNNKDIVSRGYTDKMLSLIPK